MKNNIIKNPRLSIRYNNSGKMYLVANVNGKDVVVTGDKSEDGKIRAKGSFETITDLKDAVSGGVIKPKEGWMYNIAKKGGTDDFGTKIKAGDNVVYVEISDGVYGWDDFGGLLEPEMFYITATETDTPGTYAVDSSYTLTDVGKEIKDGKTIVMYGFDTNDNQVFQTTNYFVTYSGTDIISIKFVVNDGTNNIIIAIS